MLNVKLMVKISLFFVTFLENTNFKFDEYCKKVKDIYERAFWSEEDQKVWYPMCPSLHKILYHGGDIIRLLPPTILVGFLSEEPTERSFTNYTC